MDELINLIEETTQSIKREHIVKNIEELKDTSYIVFDKEDLLGLLKVAISIVNPKSLKKVSKSITIVWKDSKPYIILNNDIEYLDYELDILNTENILTDTLCIPVEVLNSIIKMIDDYIVIYKKENSYYIKLQLQGDLPLQLFEPETQMLIRPVNELVPFNIDNSDNKISCSYVSDGLKAIVPLLEEELIIEKRRVSMDNNCILFFTNKLFIETIVKVPKIKITNRLADIIRKIASIYPDEHMSIYRDITNSSRIVVKCSNIFVTTNVITQFDNTLVKNYINTNKDKKAFSVKYNDLKRVIQIAATLPYASGSVCIKQENNELIILIPTNTKNISEFRIPIETKLEDIPNLIEIKSSLLNKLLNSFNGNDIVYLGITDKELIINANRLIGIIQN